MEKIKERLLKKWDLKMRLREEVHPPELGKFVEYVLEFEFKDKEGRRRAIRSKVERTALTESNFLTTVQECLLPIIIRALRVEEASNNP